MIATAALLMAGVATPPRALTGHIGHEDYPSRAIREERQGRVEALLTIDAMGAIASCLIKRSSGHQILDDTTCRLITTRYRFDPARNADGNPVSVQAILPVDWQLPPVEVAPATP